MRKIRAVAVLAAVAAVAVSSLTAQRPDRKYGLGITLQNSEVLPLLGADGPSDISGIRPAVAVPIWVSPRVVVEPAVSYWTLEDEFSLLRLSSAVEYHFGVGRVSPFIGGRVALISISPEVGDGLTDWLVSSMGGVEVFVIDELSLGGEFSLNFYAADGDGRDGPTYTDAALRVRFYF